MNFLSLFHSFALNGRGQVAHQMYVRGEAWFIYPDSSHTPFLIFTGGQKVRYLESVFDTSRPWAFQGQLSLPSPVGRVGKWVPTLSGKAKAGTRGVRGRQLWDPLRTRVIPERLRGVFTTRRYTNPRLSWPFDIEKDIWKLRQEPLLKF